MHSTVKSRFKKDLNLEIHLHKAYFGGNRFLDSLHKSFLNQTSLDLRKKKWTFLNQDFTVLKLRFMTFGFSKSPFFTHFQASILIFETKKVIIIWFHF